MAQIVNENILQRIYTPPSGKRDNNPTIFDELRLAMEHSQYPIDQVLQLISEFHGPWSGMNANILNIINYLSSTSGKFKGYRDYARNAIQMLKTIPTTQSSVGRINNIVANDMDVPLYRAFINKCQSISPVINNYIQLNIGKYPHFQEVSNYVGTFGQIVLGSQDVSHVNRIQSDGLKMGTSNRLGRITQSKIYKPSATLLDDSHNMVNILFNRGIRPHCTSLVNTDSSKAHGLSMMPDVKNAARIKGAMQESALQTVQHFGPTVQLLNAYYPIEYNSQNRAKLYNISAENGEYVADGLNRPVLYNPELPVADESKKNAKV